jgi:tetratricopeptide (TPR) repeat protein
VCVGRREKWPDAWLNLGLAQWRTDDRAAARRSFEKALENNPKPAAVLTALGALAVEEGDAERAGEALNKLSELGEHSPELCYNVGVLWQKAGRHEDAARLLRQAADEKPGFGEALLNLGHSLNSLGKDREARECWREAVEAAPELASLFGY